MSSAIKIGDWFLAKATTNKDAGITANLILSGTMDTPTNRKAMPGAAIPVYGKEL